MRSPPEKGNDKDRILPNPFMTWKRSKQLTAALPVGRGRDRPDMWTSLAGVGAQQLRCLLNRNSMKNEGIKNDVFLDFFPNSLQMPVPRYTS
jgi:hypothetical protein